MSAACKSCGAPIRWVEMKSGKTMPLNIAPVDDGNVVILRDLAIVLSEGERAEELQMPPAFRRPLYRSHFSTCPNAEQWRQPK